MGLRLTPCDATSVLDRVEIGSVQIATNEPGYETGAVVPADDWEPVTEQGLASLRSSTDHTADTVIELVRTSIPDLTTATVQEREEAAAKLVTGYQAAPVPRLLATATAQPGQRTTTEDGRTRLRIGIHVDNWDRLTYADRQHGRHRLGINLGPAHRYLLVADHDIQQICQQLHQETSIDLSHHYPHTDDLRRYVAAGRPLRVLRIRLDPGDGYVAPTELTPHDGSTLGATAASTIVFWLGPTGAEWNVSAQLGGSLHQVHGGRP